MFTKITKKSFIEQMTSASVIYVSGGFTSRDLTDGEFVNQIVSMCEEIDIDNSEQCRCTAQSNALVRHLSDGEKSYMYFDQKDVKRSFYQDGNILIVETIPNDRDYRNNYVIYLCV